MEVIATGFPFFLTSRRIGAASVIVEKREIRMVILAHSLRAFGSMRGIREHQSSAMHASLAK